MPTFGIIAEGITDQIVLENILCGYLGDQDEDPVVNYVQPPFDATSQGGGFAPGGWSLVFKSLEAGDHRKALQSNNYIVIQIDTDVSEEKGFDVSRREDGRELTLEELVDRVVSRLKKAMGLDFCTKYQDCIIFAVAVNQMECWLLPLFENDKAEKITGCLKTMNDERSKRNKRPLSAQGQRGDRKEPRSYEDASRPYANRRTLMKVYARNPSLKLFIERLDAMNLRAAIPPSEPPAGNVPSAGDPPASTS